jgi:hypothetical protein
LPVPWKLPSAASPWNPIPSPPRPVADLLAAWWSGVVIIS